MTRRGGEASGRPARPLRVACHNLAGARVSLARDAQRVEAAVQQWAQLQLDVVLLQETHHTCAQDHDNLAQALRGATEWRHLPGWHIAAHSWSSAGNRTAGVAVLVRADLVPAAAIRHLPAPAGVPPGWYTACAFTWAGHQLQLASIYMPHSGREDAATIRQQLFQQCLDPAALAAAAEDGPTLVWGGDFNFVEDPALDSSAGPASRPGDAAPASQLRAAGTAVDMVDAHRALHPSRRDYTHLYRAPHRGGSRLDRLYVPRASLPYISASYVPHASPSDHRPSILHIAPKAPPGRSQGPRRVRMFFASHTPLRQQLEAWLDGQVAAMPVGPQRQHDEMLAWWPGFKRALAAKVAELNREAVLRRTQPGADVQSLLDAASAALDALDATPGDPACIAAAVDAQVAVSAAMRQAAGTQVQAARRRTISAGERPSRGLTALVHDLDRLRGDGEEGASGGPVTLRHPRTGQLVYDPARIAQIIADYWQSVSALPTEAELPQAQRQAAAEQVLGALRAHPLRLPDDTDTTVGKPDVSAEEMYTVLKHVTPGKAPGWDGLPADLYKSFRGPFSKLLAALYTAIGNTGQTPDRFADGVIKVLFKKGDRTLPGNYRPITLLNTDYRILARLLATRLGPALDKAISPEQTAFLPRRLIGCNIFALRHLPYLLRRQHRSAIVAFLDFAKAYDTVHRDFLMAAMTELGAGPKLCSWVTTLLASTKAQALVNGYLSDPVTMAAGVRQGCPLAPLLYLFVAQALLSWLQHNNLGVRLDPASADRTAAVQFADDGQVLLDSVAEVPVFLAAMETFAQASGQKLNLDKVELLRVGVLAVAPPPAAPPPGPAAPAPAGGPAGLPALPPPPPPPPPPPNPAQQQPVAPGPSIQGLRVALAVTALGIQFSNDPDAAPQGDWSRASAEIKRRIDRLLRARLSAFGLALGAWAYAAQTQLYRWEHGGPPPAEVDCLERWMAGLADRRVSPSHPEQRLTGVPRQLLTGRPANGGFGALPTTQHNTARTIMWAIRLARMVGPDAAQPHPWVRISTQILASHHPNLGPGSVFTTPAAGSAIPGASALPTDLHRILTALAHLAPVQDVAPHELQPGPWCCNAPLWGNPLLPNAAQAPAAAAADGEEEDAAGDADFVAPETAPGEASIIGPRPGLDTRHTWLAGCHALRTLGDAISALAELSNPGALSGPAWDQWLATRLAPDPSCRPKTLARVRMALLSLLGDISIAWRVAAETALANGSAATAPLEGAVRGTIVERLGWRVGTAVIPLKQLTVKAATWMQMGAVERQRTQMHAAYEREARQQLAGPAAGPAPAADAPPKVVPVLTRLWRVAWEREHKETFWRLTVDGVPLPGNSHLSQLAPEACACGCYGGAAAVTGSPRAHHFWECPVAKAVVDQIAAHVPGTISRAHLWMAEPPAGMQQCVWDVVVLAATSAMEWARVGLRAALGRAQTPSGQLAAQPNEGGVVETNAGHVERAKARAVVDFWQRLRCFAALGVPEKGWEGVQADHPILSVQEGRLCCVRPGQLDMGSQLVEHSEDEL